MTDTIRLIQDDLKAAMKSRNELVLSVLRLLKSDLQYEMNKTGVDSLPEEDIQAAIKRAIKKRSDAAEQFSAAGRNDDAQRERDELELLKRYLPAEVSESAIATALDQIFSEMNPESPADIGKVMGRAMAMFKGQNIDGKLVNKLASERLSN